MREVNTASFKGALGVLSTTTAVGLDFDNLDVSPHRRKDMTLENREWIYSNPVRISKVHTLCQAVGRYLAILYMRPAVIANHHLICGSLFVVVIGAELIKMKFPENVTIYILA